MTGQAEFTSVSETEYHYTEQGVLTLDHGEEIMDVKRSYDYRFEDCVIQIYYADGPDNGKLFQTLEFKNDIEAVAEHLCGEDLYKSQYVFDLPDSFIIKHEVQGPKKDYVSETKYTKQP